MKRAYLIELTIFRDYGKQLLALGFLVAVLVGCGMQTVLAAPSIITCMFFMMGAMGAAAYDEQNDWGRFRLTLPLSRRDVVLGRYAAIVTLGLGGMAVGLLAAFAISAVSGAVELPGELSQALTLDPGTLSGMAFATTFCLLIGATVASVVTPIYFRLGQTKATQLLPTIIVLLFVLPVVFLGNSGLLDGALPGAEQIASFLAYIETPGGLFVGCAGMVAAAVVILAVSAAISLRLYETREL